MRKTSLEWVHRLAQKDPRVLFIGSDLGAGVLESMRVEMPDRWYMEGVAEQHIIGMAAGLAMEGFLPYVNTIATFLTRRCYEQLVVDVGLHHAPIRLIGNGGGVVYAPLGPTHQAIEDIAMMRLIPNMTVIAPCDADEMARVMEASLVWPDPIYLRLAKGGDSIVSHPTDGFEIGKAVVYREPGKVLLVSTGIMTQRALEVSTMLEKMGISCGVLHMHTVKPCDDKMLLDLASEVRIVVTLEEHKRDGGLGTIVLETLSELNVAKVPKVVRKGIPDSFPTQYGSQDSLLESWRLDAKSLVVDIEKEILERI